MLLLEIAGLNFAISLRTPMLHVKIHGFPAQHGSRHLSCVVSFKKPARLGFDDEHFLGRTIFFEGTKSGTEDYDESQLTSLSCLFTFFHYGDN